MSKNKIITPARTITETDIVIFAGLSGDYHPAHTNEVYATQKSINGKRIAHGLLILSVSEGLFIRTNYFDWENEPLVTLGFDNVKFPNPVFIGDTIHSEFEIASERDSKSRPGMKVIILHGIVKNQRDEIVCEYDHPILVKKGRYTIGKQSTEI